VKYKATTTTNSFFILCPRGSLNKQETVPNKCPLKGKCLRYNTSSKNPWHIYFTTPPYLTEVTDCKHFFPMTTEIKEG